jgi:histidinol-phosphatase
MSSSVIDDARRAAIRAVTAAAEVIETFLANGDWQVTLKADDSPVTEVDIAAEKAIRSILIDALPEAAFYGEETGHSGGSGGRAKYRWLVDPIDGTKSFIRGMPFYSTQIALEADGQLVLGVSNAPAYGERLVAAEGEGAWLNDRQVQVRSEITRVEDAFLSSGNLSSLAAESELWTRYGSVVNRARRVRGYGDFCHYHQLCMGQTDLIIESDVNILDIAALTVAVREAGGIITDLAGKAIDKQTTSVLAAATVELHAEVLSLGLS